jgi:hypothetical protein
MIFMDFPIEALVSHSGTDAGATAAWLPSFSDLRAWRMIENDRNIHGPSKYLEK